MHRNRLNAIAVLLSLLGYGGLNAQSAYANRTAACRQACLTDDPGAAGSSAVNPFFQAGAQFGASLLQRGDFAFSPFAIGHLQFNLIEPSTQRVGLALISNLEKPDAKDLRSRKEIEQKLAEVLSAEDGVRAMLQLYALSHTNEQRLQRSGRSNGVFWVSAALKLVPAKDSLKPEGEWLQHGRLSAGGEIHWYRSAIDSLPLTISIEPAYTIGQKGDYRRLFRAIESQRWSSDLTVIVPLRYTFGLNTLGRVPALNTLLLDATVGQQIKPSYRVGFLVMK